MSNSYFTEAMTHHNFLNTGPVGMEKLHTAKFEIIFSGRPLAEIIWKKAKKSTLMLQYWETKICDEHSGLRHIYIFFFTKKDPRLTIDFWVLADQLRTTEIENLFQYSLIIKQTLYTNT